MDNNNNEMPLAGPGTPEPQMEQSVPAQPVMEQPIADQATPQPASQPTAQPVMGQQIMGQPIGQPIMTAQPMAQPAVGAEATETKKKKGLIIGCCVGAGVVVAALVAVLLIFFLKGSEKVVSCTMQTSFLGVDMKNEANIRIGNGKINGASVITNLNLKNLEYKDYEEETVNSVVEEAKESCTEHCKLNRDYVAGDYLKITMEYDEEGAENMFGAYGIEGMTAQEIADQLQEAVEYTGGTTCKQS